MATIHDPLPAIEDEPQAADMHVPDELLYEFNVEQTDLADGQRYALFLRDEDNRVVGGAHGWTWGGTCYVAVLYLPKSLRRGGVGNRLMAAIEAEARTRDCDQIVLRTHDFQAPEFYRKLGFADRFEIDYPRGHRLFTLVKRL